MDASNFFQNEEKNSSWFRQLLTVLFWFVLPLALGVWVAWRIVPVSKIAVVRLETDIWSGSAQFFKLQLDVARETPGVRAVVLVIDSPGGEVTPTQDMFLEILSLREVMPVVGSINGIAASGGFYLSLAADPVFTKPNSTVGNVGVWGYVPSEIGVNDVVLASGPFKLTASNQEEFLKEIEAIKQEFLLTTSVQRGERMEISLADLSQGLAYTGRQAVDFGLVDAIGSQADAVIKAAEMAKIANYQVIEAQDIVIEKLLEESTTYNRQVDETDIVNGDTPDGSEILATGRPVHNLPAISLHLDDYPWYLQQWLSAPDQVSGERLLPPGIYLLFDTRAGTSGGRQ